MPLQQPEDSEVGEPDQPEVDQPGKLQPTEHPEAEDELEKPGEIEDDEIEDDEDVVMVGEKGSDSVPEVKPGESLEVEKDLDMEFEKEEDAPVVPRVDQFKQKKENHPPGRRGRPPKKGDSKSGKPRAKATAKAEAKSKAKAKASPKSKAKAKASPKSKAKAKASPKPKVEGLPRPSSRRPRISIDDIIPPTPAPPRQSMPERGVTEPEPVSAPAAPPAPEPAPAPAASGRGRAGKKRAAVPAPAPLGPSSSAPSAPSTGAAEAAAAEVAAALPKKRAPKKQKKADPNESVPVPDPDDSGVSEADGGRKVKEKSFARRAMPKTQPALMKWKAIRDIFHQQVRPELGEFSRFPGRHEEKGSSPNPTNHFESS
jgi:hypothetical protein